MHMYASPVITRINVEDTSLHHIRRVWCAEHHDGGILQDDSLVYNHSRDNISE